MKIFPKCVFGRDYFDFSQGNLWTDFHLTIFFVLHMSEKAIDYEKPFFL